MKRCLLFCFTLGFFILTGCLTGNQNQVGGGFSSDTFPAQEQVRELITRSELSAIEAYYLPEKRSVLPSLSAELNSMQKSINGSAVLSARVLGLKLYLDYLVQVQSKEVKSAEVRKWADSVAGLNSTEEFCFVFKAIAATSIVEKTSLFEEGFSKLENPSFLKIHYAQFLLTSGRFLDAANQFDLMSVSFPDSVRSILVERRLEARQFDALGKSLFGDMTVAIEGFRNGSYSRSQAVQILLTNTRLLNFLPLSGVSNDSDYTLLLYKGFISFDPPQKDFIFTRADGAQLFGSILAFYEKEPDIFSSYVLEYTSTNGTPAKSPFKDVASDTYMFPYVLYAVEASMIPLLDGVNFAPEAPLSASDFLKVISFLDRFRKN